MRHFLSVTLLLITILLLSNSQISHGQKKSVMEYEDPDTRIIVNGSDDEWHHLHYNQDAQLMYGVFNDKDNLYVCLKTSDAKLQKKIMRLGLIVWIDTTGKNKEITGIKFPLAIKEKEHTQLPVTADKKDPDAFKEQFLKNNQEMDIIGFPVLKEQEKEFTRISAFSKLGIKASINVDSLGNFIYELKIPFSVLLTDRHAPEGKLFGFKFTTGKPEWHASEVPMGGGGIGLSHGAMSNSGSGGRSGGHRGSGGKSKGTQSGTEPMEVKTKVQLR